MKPGQRGQAAPAGDAGKAAELRFGVFAETYDAARPDYPAEAVAWLVEGVQGPVAEIGAGTGKFTRALVGLGLRVLAIEPDAAMLSGLLRRAPGAVPVRAVAEALPLARASVGAVVAAQAWHWFDAARAWDSAMRVLAPSGRIAVAWNAPSQRSSWQREIAALGPVISPVSEDWWPPGIPRQAMEKKLFRWAQRLTPRQVRDEYSTHLAVRKLDEASRAAYLEAVTRAASRAAGGNGDGLVRFQRLTWCARLARP